MCEGDVSKQLKDNFSLLMLCSKSYPQKRNEGGNVVENDLPEPWLRVLHLVDTHISNEAIYRRLFAPWDSNLRALGASLLTVAEPVTRGDVVCLPRVTWEVSGVQTDELVRLAAIAKNLSEEQIRRQGFFLERQHTCQPKTQLLFCDGFGEFLTTQGQPNIQVIIYDHRILILAHKTIMPGEPLVRPRPPFSSA